VKNPIVRIALALSLFLLAAGNKAEAGTKSTDLVYVGSNSVQGSLGSARNSGDFNQFISINNFSGSGWAYMEMGARDASGVSRYCYSSNANFIARHGASAMPRGSM